MFVEFCSVYRLGKTAVCDYQRFNGCVSEPFQTNCSADKWFGFFTYYRDNCFANLGISDCFRLASS